MSTGKFLSFNLLAKAPGGDSGLFLAFSSNSAGVLAFLLILVIVILPL